MRTVPFIIRNAFRLLHLEDDTPTLRNVSTKGENAVG